MKNYGILAFLMCLLILLNGCDNENKMGCSAPPCQTYAVAKQMDCSAFGAFDDIYLQLEDGTILQPYDNISGVSSIEDGQIYQIDYQVIESDNRYDNLALCELYNPEVDGATTAQITCITQSECQNIGTLKMLDLDGCGYVIEMEDGTIFEPIFNESTQNFLNLANMTSEVQIRFSYEIAMDMASICMRGELARITCFKLIDSE